jgi:hypothetical protein
MLDIQQSGGCACCGPAAEVTGTDSGVEATVRAGFVAGAEQLGIGGDDLAGLVGLFDAGDCPATRARMADLVAARLAVAQQRGVDATGRAAAIQAAHGGGRPGLPAGVVGVQEDIVASLAAVARLRAAAERLAATPAPGRCHDGCACASAASAHTNPGIPMTGRALTGDTAADIVCTFDGGQDAMAARVNEWTAVVALATGREAADGGVTLVYDHDPDLAVELARLAAAEFECCSFFTFTLTVGPDGMRFTVTAPEAAGDAVTAMFGTATPAPVGGA